MDRIIKKKRFTPKKIAIYSISGVFVLFVLYSLIFASHEKKLNVRAERLTISEVREGMYLDYIPANGTVLPIETYYLDAVEGGVVESLYVQEGTFLDKGQPILKLSNTNLLLDIMYREAELFQQINNLRNTRLLMQQNELDLKSQLLDLDNNIADQQRVFQKNEELNKQNLISSIDFEQSKDRYNYLLKRRELTLENHKIDSTFRAIQIEQLESGVQRMEKNLEIIKERQDRLTLRAPIKGQLTQLNGEIGVSLSSGERIGQIDKVDGFKVRAAPDEHYIARIQNGLRGTFDFNGRTFELEISRVYPEVRNGRFEVDMKFTGEEPEGIRRGQTVRIRLELGGATPAILLSQGGFYQSTGGQWVYVLSDDGKSATKRDIRISRQNNTDYEIVEGLRPGEMVVTSSYDNFGDADRLILK